MNNIYVLLLTILILLFVNKNSVESFTMGLYDSKKREDLNELCRFHQKRGFNETKIEEICLINEEKTKLEGEKMTIQSTLSNDNTIDSGSEEDIYFRLTEIDTKIAEINQKLDKKEAEIKKDKVEEEKEEKVVVEVKEEKEKVEDVEEDIVKDEESIYTEFIQWNKKMYDNYFINGLIVFFTVILILFFLYFFYKFISEANRKRKLKVKNVDIKYENIIEELKKNEIKNSLTMKKIKN